MYPIAHLSTATGKKETTHGTKYALFVLSITVKIIN